MQFSAKVNVLATPMGALKAYATLVIDEKIELTGFRIMEGTKGTFVAGPQTKGKPGEDGKDQWFDNIRYTDMDTESKRSDTKDSVSEVIMAAYKTAMPDTRARTASARIDDPKPTGKKPAMARTANW